MLNAENESARHCRAAHPVGLSPRLVGVLLVEHSMADYRRFAFLAVLRGAFLAAFLRPPFLAFLATFFAFLAMPWLLYVTATKPQYVVIVLRARTNASEKKSRDEFATRVTRTSKYARDASDATHRNDSRAPHIR